MQSIECEKEPVIKETTVQLDNTTFHVVSVFQGTKTSSELLYELALKRILYEDNPFSNLS